MANIQYTSIVRLLQHCDVDIQQPLHINRVRKQVAAEFAMSANGFVEIGERTYNKSDVLEELDKPDFLDRWQLHLIIWHNKQILQLLEDEFVNMDTIGQELNPYRKDEIFIAFFSPYFKNNFNNMCRSLLYPPQFDILALFLKTQQLLLPQDFEEAFNSILKFLLAQERDLKNTTKDNYGLNRDALSIWRTENWSAFFNMLPDTFYELKDDIIIRFINLTVNIQSSSRADCKMYSSQMIKLAGIDAEHKRLIINNHGAFNGSSTNSEGGRSYWWILWVAIMLLRFASSSSCH